MFYIEIEDLAANAFIEAIHEGGSPSFSFKELEVYGEKVVRLLNTKGVKAVLLLSRDRTLEFFNVYSDFFREKSVGSLRCVELKEGITLENLIAKFRGYLAIEVLMALTNREAVAKLGIGNCRNY